MIRGIVLVVLLLAPISSEPVARPTATPDWPVFYDPPPSRGWTPPDPYSAIVARASLETGVPARILGRLIEAESAWDPQALNINLDGSRDLGIAQLGERWISDFIWFDNGGKWFDPFNPEQAIPVAARYLHRLYRAAGSWPSAVAAYNCGLSRFRGGDIPGRTLAYVAKIMEEKAK